MNLFSAVFLLGVCFLVAGCRAVEETSEPGGPQPPLAKIIPKRLEKHGHARTDNYYWLNDRNNPEVIAYLQAENRYADAAMVHTRDLQDTLFEEIKGRIKPNDETVPYKKDGYLYYTRFEEAKEYPIFCRKKGSLDGAERIMLDANVLARGHAFFSVQNLEVSSGNDLLAYATDTQGRRIYTLFFKNLETGEILQDVIRRVTGNAAWANDNKTLFYTRQDPVTLRPFQVYRHVLGTDPSEDGLVYEEKDETFFTVVFKTKSKKYVMISSQQTLSSEYRYLDADDPLGTFKVFQFRERGREYSVEHYGERFYIRTNDQAKNFRLMETPVTKTGRENWQEVIPHREGVFLQDFALFKDYLVLSERRDGLDQIRIIPWSGGEGHSLDFGEPAYSANLDMNPEFDTPVLRYVYSSLTTPRATFDYDMKNKEKTLRKQDQVLGGFDSRNYQTERLTAAARDGSTIPISLVFRRATKKDGGNPLLLYGYGSYGASMDVSFNSSVVSLLDRGFIYGIAHIRGGQEYGRQWYEEGKLLKKKNTFTDFIACAEFLVQEKYTRPERLFAMGGSAGGLLMGAVLNMRPDLFYGIVARVPFVDVVTTMLDPGIPLTTSEYDEWGNPEEKKYYNYILSYSPYDNLEAKEYPHLLVTAGLHDSQVQYWEPAKWVAKLRALKKGENRLLLKTNMEAGHSGASGRFRMHKETAFIYAFLLDLAGIQKVEDDVPAALDSPARAGKEEKV